MRLPDDNSLELPATNDDLVLDRSDRPVPTVDDAVALLPGWAQDVDSPVRDALLAAWRAGANLLWARTGHALGRVASPAYADGPWLDAPHGELAHRRRTADESDADYRARLLNPPDVVSPDAIRAAVDALVPAPLAAAYLEPATDAAFAAPLACPWVAFVQPADRRLWADYPDNPNATVGAYVVPDVEVPLLWVVLPSDGSEGEPLAYAEPVDATPADSFAAPATGAAYAYAFPRGETLLERARSEIEARRAAGVPWFGLNDPLLADAR